MGLIGRTPKSLCGGTRGQNRRLLPHSSLWAGDWGAWAWREVTAWCFALACVDLLSLVVEEDIFNTPVFSSTYGSSFSS